LTEDGAKVYEFNADSSGILFECGYSQDKWAKEMNLGAVGRDIGDRVLTDLIETWKNLKINGTLYLMHDFDKEEKYLTLYV
jgi:glutathionylspermidine synthase